MRPTRILLLRCSHMSVMHVLMALLLSAKAAESGDVCGNRGLYNAAENGHIDVVEKLIAADTTWTKQRRTV